MIERMRIETALKLFDLMAKSSTLPALSALNEFVKGNNFEEAGIVLEVVKDCRILADVQQSLRRNCHFSRSLPRPQFLLPASALHCKVLD